MARRRKSAVEFVLLLCLVLLVGYVWLPGTGHSVSLPPPKAARPAVDRSLQRGAVLPVDAPAVDSTDPFAMLLVRVFGQSDASRVRVTYTASSKAFFRFSTEGDQLHIEADGPLSAASAVHRFCRDVGKCTTTWGVTRKARLPARLPPMPLPQPARSRPFPWVYYLNYCTASYTMAWWDWDRWEQELDWMALHGITTPLIATGREVVMRALLLQEGMTESAILDYFTGPAFLAWHRMGNLKSFGGPLPRAYLDRAQVLTKQILTRARELGMRPVLPGFSGQVPQALHELHREATLSTLPRWLGFPSQYSGLSFVEPKSALYTSLGARFIRIQTEMFGTDHLYAVDQFNENDPHSDDSSYLAACGKAQYESLRQGDPEAVWLMQGWLFVFHANFWKPKQIEAYTSLVPRSGLVVLDLISEASPAYESTEQYHGSSWVWCVLHNFGGQNGLRGNLKTLMNRPYDALTATGSKMKGIGLTMEAIEQNPVVYELLLDHAWHDAPRNLTEWLDQWVVARYDPVGGARSKVTRAWREMLHSSYSAADPAGNGFWGVPKSVIEKRPSLNRASVVHQGFQSTQLQYNGCAIHNAWNLLLRAATHKPQQLVEAVRAERLMSEWGIEMPAVAANDPAPPGSALRLDLLDVTRQALADLAAGYYIKFVGSLKRRSAAAPAKIAAQFLELLDDLDALLETSNHFSFSHWLHTARAVAAGPEEHQLYGFNARNLVTRWGPNGQISDYSSRLWAGLIRSYYKQRWKLALHLTVKAHAEGRKPSDSIFQHELNEFEEQWQHRGMELEAVPRHLEVKADGIVDAIKQAYNKYHDMSREMCSMID